MKNIRAKNSAKSMNVMNTNIQHTQNSFITKMQKNIS